MQVRTPQFENKINLNTILLFVAIVVPSVGWGMSWSTVKTQQAQNIDAIKSLQTQLMSVQQDSRQFDSLSYRVTAVENAVTTLGANQQDQGKTLNELSSDMRVVREIVERLDAERNGDRRPP